MSIDAIAERIARCRIATSASVVPAATATIAFCSASDRPRVHAPNISAETKIKLRFGASAPRLSLVVVYPSSAASIRRRRDVSSIGPGSVG